MRENYTVENMIKITSCDGFQFLTEADEEMGCVQVTYKEDGKPSEVSLQVEPALARLIAAAMIKIADEMELG